MKMFVIAAALVSVSFGATAHEWYSGLKMPGARVSCCNERDCEPVEHRYGVGGRDELLIDGECHRYDIRLLDHIEEFERIRRGR